ncbi:MAG: hypothetical protein AB8B99_12505 [Phormidesmis sp.]
MRMKFITLSSALLCAAAILSPIAKAAELLKDSAAPTGPLVTQPKAQPASNSAALLDLLPVGNYSTIEALRTSGRTASEGETLAQSLPSPAQILQIQQDLRDLELPTPTASPRRAYPSISISNPTGYGADKGQIFAGVGYQSRTRFSGGANPGTPFGGGSQDGAVGIGFGLGDARRSIGVQLSYVAASFGGSRDPLSGGINVKVHKRFGNNWAAAVGGDGIINFGRLPENGASGNGVVEFNDFENTYYGSVSHIVSLREDYNQPFSRLILTGGAGTGRFRSVDQIVNGEFGVGVFGSAALQVVPSTNLITEWTGQDLAVGVSVAPFRNVPIVFTPALRDLAGEGDGDPRFVLGIGFSLNDLF